MTILVTRPSPAGEQLVSRLRALGRVAYHAPLIDFSPGEDLPKLPALLQDMQAGDLVFALSQNAVRYASPLLKRNNLSWPAQLSYYAIGRNTALALHTVSRLHVTFPHGRDQRDAVIIARLAKFGGQEGAVITR